MPIDRGELLSAIDFELELYNQETQRNGWTRWIILGAIAAALAASLEAVYATGFDLESAMMVFTAISFGLMPFIAVFIPIFGDSGLGISAGRFVHASRQFRCNLSLVLTQSLWLTLASLSLYYFRSEVPPWASSLTIAFACLGILLLVVRLVLSRLDQFVQPQQPPPWAHLTALPVYCLLFYTAWALLTGALPLDAPNVKAGSLAVAILILVMVLAELDPFAATRRQLAGLRRDVTLIPLSTEEGITQLDLLVRGISLPTLVLPKLDAFLSDQRTALTLIEDMRKTVKKINEKIEHSRPPQEISHGFTVLVAMARNINVIKDRASASYNELNSTLRRVNVGADRDLAIQLEGWNADAAKTWNEISEKIKVSQEELDRLDETLKEIEKQDKRSSRLTRDTETI